MRPHLLELEELNPAREHQAEHESLECHHFILIPESNVMPPHEDAMKCHISRTIWPYQPLFIRARKSPGRRALTHLYAGTSKPVQPLRELLTPVHLTNGDFLELRADPAHP